MAIYPTPNVSTERIDHLNLFDAFRLAEELFESRHPRDAVRMLTKVIAAEPDNPAATELLGLALDRQNRYTEAACFHRLAAAMGSDAHDATRVALTDNPAPIGGTT